METKAVPEVELARRLMAGDGSAFEPFVEILHNKIFQYSFLMCGHREDAEEVSQETLMNAFQNFATLREAENVRAWIFRIARNVCYLRRRKSVFAPERELSLDELMPAFNDKTGHRKLEIADWSALPEQKFADSEMRGLLHKAIATLPDLYKSVLLMRDIEEMTTAETAEVLEVTEDTVKTRLHRARVAVRNKLDEYLRSTGAPK